MFLRRDERRKNGKAHTYWAWAESYRTAQGSRQRIVAYLGELSADEQDGNTHDSKTVQTMVESLEKKHGALNRVWVMNRGMVSEENLKFLRARNSQYLVGTPKSLLREFEQHLTEQNWTEAQAGVEVKLVPALEGDETFVLARSVDRRAKELAMHEKFTARVEAGLQKMRAAAEAGRLKDEAVAGERLGRLKQRNWRASHAFDVTIKKLPEPKGKQHLEITWQRNAKFGDWSQLVDGCYLLRSNLKGVDAATLLEEIAKLKSGDVTLTARSSKNAPERTITLRVVTEPDSAQAVLLQRLGLTLPRRLRRIDHPVQM